MLTFGNVQSSSVATVAGCNVASQQFADRVNESVRQLMDLGDWFGTVEPIRVTAVGNFVTWPSKVVAVLGMTVDGCVPEMKDVWYSFQPLNERDRGWANMWLRGDRSHVVEIKGTVPVFIPISATSPVLLKFSCDNPADYGKAVTVYGLDSNGREIYTGSSRGFTITLDATWPVMPFPVTNVTQIAKQKTAGLVRAWSFAPGIGIIAPAWLGTGGQQTPQFVYSNLHGNHNPNRTHYIRGLVKWGFEDVSQPSDLIPINNIDAIKSMVQANRKREAGDDEAGDKLEQTAIRRLNMEVETRFPVDQIIVENRTFGDSNIERRINRRPF